VSLLQTRDLKKLFGDLRAVDGVDFSVEAGEVRARRWEVERTLFWLNRFRKLLVRFEKLRVSHLALLELACALIVFRQTMVIHV